MSGTTSTGTITPFQPTNAGPFQFGATLDGTAYVCQVRWNLYHWTSGPNWTRYKGPGFDLFVGTHNGPYYFDSGSIRRAQT